MEYDLGAAVSLIPLQYFVKNFNLTFKPTSLLLQGVSHQIQSLGEIFVKVFCLDTNVKEFRSFLGLINFYSAFLPSASTLLKPFRILPEKSKEFLWTEACHNAFVAAKQFLFKSNFVCPRRSVSLT